MNIGKIIDQKDQVHRCLYTECKKLNARIAVVGTKKSASFLLQSIGDTDISLIGVYEGAGFVENQIFQGHTVKPLKELSRLNANDVVVIASSAEATELYDTFMTIQSLCACKTIHLKTLMNVFSIIDELKEPLRFQFDEFIFGRGRLPLKNESPYWHPVPPDVDFKDKTVLELGPFEGHDTVMLMDQKPKKVIGIEARPINYAKISVTRSLYNWSNYELILGDMHLFPELIDEKLDIIFCAGVFYHTDKPWWLLENCMRHSDTIVLCGHISSEHSRPDRQFREVALESGTYSFEIYPEYGWDDGLSGVTRDSLWFKEKDLVHFLDYHGFSFNKYSTHVNHLGEWMMSIVARK